MWVGGVGWSQTFNQNYFYGLFFLSFLFVDKFTEIEGVLTSEFQIWGGLAGSQVWDFFPNKPFFTTSLMEMKEENTLLLDNLNGELTVVETVEQPARIRRNFSLVART